MSHKKFSDKEIREILEEQGWLDYLEEWCFAITEGDFCYECNTHKHICGHETAIIIAATENFLENYNEIRKGR